MSAAKKYVLDANFAVAVFFVREDERWAFRSKRP